MTSQHGWEDVHVRPVALAAEDELDDLAAPDEEPRPSFLERVGAAPVLLFVVVTAPLADSALFKDRTNTVGSFASFKGIPCRYVRIKFTYHAIYPSYSAVRSRKLEAEPINGL